MTDWWELPYEGGKMIALPGFPRPCFHPMRPRGRDAVDRGADVIGYKRTVARLGRWE